MGDKMRAILIKTDAQSVEQVEFNGSLDHAYQLLGIDSGSRLVQMLTFDQIGLPGNGALLVDEEGALRPATMRMGQFCLGSFPQRLFGRGLVVGLKAGDDGDEWDNAPVSLATVRKRLLLL